MTSAADLGGSFIILDVTAIALAQININMRKTGPWETLDNDQFRGGNGQNHASLFTSNHALKRFTQDHVVTRFRLARAKVPN